MVNFSHHCRFIIILKFLLACRRESIIEELRRIDYEGPIQKPINWGLVKISDLNFLTNRVIERSKQHTRWFVCVLGCNTKVFATEANVSDGVGNVIFPAQFIFDELTQDFEIEIRIFSMTVKNGLRNFSHESKFHLNKVSFLCCIHNNNAFENCVSILCGEKSFNANWANLEEQYRQFLIYLMGDEEVIF